MQACEEIVKDVQSRRNFNLDDKAPLITVPSRSTGSQMLSQHSIEKFFAQNQINLSNESCKG